MGFEPVDFVGSQMYHFCTVIRGLAACLFSAAGPYIFWRLCNDFSLAASNVQVMEMVKFRDARFCNLKVLLIYLVVYGHLIESNIWDSQLLMAQYRWIYLVHMPLFSFLSGLFVKSAEGCWKQLKRLLPLYTLLQAIAVVIGKGAVQPLTPFWHLWYLLSSCAWNGVGWLWFRFGKGKGKVLILVCAVLAGCAVGFISSVGRQHSLSRTVVFFPYFWIGLICDPKFQWEKLRAIGAAALGMTVLVMIKWGHLIPVTFLYQAAPYGAGENGFWLRLLCYLLGMALGLFLLAFVPARRFPFTRAGADTMVVYLTHAPIVLWVRESNTPWTCYPLIAAMILYAAYKITQWHGEMYGIVPQERRGNRWLRFRKSMRNMLSRSIDSCGPW